MRSLRSRLVVIVAVLSLVAVATVTVIVAITTNDAVEEVLASQREARTQIVGDLNVLALSIESWSQARTEVEELADALGVRIVLTDIDGIRLVDTGDGPLPALEGFIDPFGPLAEFTDDAVFDFETYTSVLIECLDRSGIDFEVNELGEVFLFDDRFDEAAREQVDTCLDAAIEAVEDGTAVFGEPALLFIGFDTAPSIPWGLVALIAAGVIAVAALAAAPLSGLVTRSLRSLTAAARSISDGDLDVRVEAASPTEVADLAASFNDMAEELGRAEERRKQLTADVAHELRSPLTNILGHLDAIEDGVIDPTPDQIEIITSEAARLSHLVDDLQTLAALDEEALVLDLRPTDVCDLIDRSIGARSSRARERGVTVVRDGACRGPVPVDGTRIDQIVGNLLDNALEHTPDGGVITVDVDDGPDLVTIGVGDTGPGIDPDLLPRVFDRLSRADAARGPDDRGRGLGLAIAQGLARAHGGDLTAENVPGAGARFALILRRSASPT